MTASSGPVFVLTVTVPSVEFVEFPSASSA